MTRSDRSSHERTTDNSLYLYIDEAARSVKPKMSSLRGARFVVSRAPPGGRRRLSWASYEAAAAPRQVHVLPATQRAGYIERAGSSAHAGSAVHAGSAARVRAPARAARAARGPRDARADAETKIRREAQHTGHFTAILVMARRGGASRAPTWLAVRAGLIEITVVVTAPRQRRCLHTLLHPA
ncbi:hypothetical protein [Sorangium sp. So ce513]|uniref:hypothetical protein n=1 Tax=Sorangium sp. So ce513 TaxID=3133315 RepID=UPI003F5E8DF7